MSNRKDIMRRNESAKFFRSPQHALIVTAAALLYAGITYSRKEIIAASIGSCARTAFSVLLHPSSAFACIDPALFEYWIAAAAWCALGIVPTAAFFRQLRRAQKRTDRISPALSVLAAFIIASVCAPIIAPFPPLAQGDLAHTRFLPPLGTGWCIIHAPEAAASAGGEIDETLPAKTASLLLRRSYEFSGNGGRVSPEKAGAFPVIFLFGTDAMGRDIFSRVVYGSRYSIGIGMMVVLISVSFGSCIGMLAGYRGGLIDSFFMRTVDVLMSIPTLFLVLTLMALLGQSVAAMIAVLAATEWMGIARIVRGEALHLRGREFICASRLLGTSSFGVLRRHLFPNIRPVIIYSAVLQLGNIFLAEASLSFLGLGIQAPNPSWGNMIAESMGHAQAGIAGGIFPGIALSALLLTVYTIGSTGSRNPAGLRD